MVKCINLDFQVLKTECGGKLMIADMSEWGAISNSPAIVEITLPAGIKPWTYEWDKGSINLFDMYSFNVPCGCSSGGTSSCGLGCSSSSVSGSHTEGDIGLPDGMYKIKLIGSPSSRFMEKIHLRTTDMDMQLAMVLVGITDPTGDEYKRYRHIKFLLDSARANIRLGYNIQAGKMYQEAIAELEQLKKNCNG